MQGRLADTRWDDRRFIYIYNIKGLFVLLCCGMDGYIDFCAEHTFISLPRGGQARADRCGQHGALRR